MMHATRIVRADLHNERCVKVTYSRPINLPMPIQCKSKDYIWPEYDSLEGIRDQTIKLFGLYLDDFTGDRKEMWFVAARQYFCYHARMFSARDKGQKASLMNIARLTGRTDHSSAIYSGNRHALAWGLARHWSLEGGRTKSMYEESLAEYRKNFGEFRQMQKLSDLNATYYSDERHNHPNSRYGARLTMKILGLDGKGVPKKTLDANILTEDNMKALGL